MHRGRNVSDFASISPPDETSAVASEFSEQVEIAASAVVYPGTVLGAGCKVGDHAVVGKQPSLSPRSSTKKEPLPPVVIGAGTIISTGAIVFAGTRIGERVIVGDQSCVRERV